MYNKIKVKGAMVAQKHCHEQCLVKCVNITLLLI